jgi:(R,R)-butanediol dehydrogenase/meso-butanediol dehydrogenase/diacetyl reductase
MAEYVAVPATTLKKIPIGLPDDMAGLVQPLAVGIHAARRSGAKNGDTVVIIGAGAIGTFVLAGLNYLAEVSSILVDFDGPRLDRARRLGATHVVPVAENTEDELRKLVGESGADIVIEASGAPGQMQRALKWVRRGGTLLQVGLPSTPVEIDAHHAVMSEITIQTTLAHVCGEDVEPAFEILATSSLGQGLLEGVFGLDQLENQLNELASGKIQGKVLFDPRR